MMAGGEMENVPLDAGITKIEPADAGNIFQRISIFVTSNVLSNFVSMITSLAIARLMSPLIFGEWQTFRLFLQYSMYANLGINTVISRRLPQLSRSEEHLQLFHHIRNSAYSFNLITATGAAFILFPIMVFKTKFSFLLILSIVIIMLIQLLYTFRFSSLVAQKNLESTARLVSVFSFAGFLFILPLTYLYQLQGAILGQLAVYLLVFFLACKFDISSYTFSFDFRTLASLLREGFLFFLHGLIATFGLGHERLLLLYLHGTPALGTYGLAILVMGIFEGIASSFFLGFFPFLSGKSNPERPEESETMALEGLQLLSLALLLVGIIAATFLGPLTRIFLPKYEAGLWAAFLAIGSMLFIPIRFMAVYYRASWDEIYQPILVYVGVLTIILLPNYFIIRDYGLIGAAIAQTIAQIAITVCLLYTMGWKNKLETVKIFLKTGVLFFIILAIGWVSIHYNLLAIPLGVSILSIFILASGARFRHYAQQFLRGRS
jgi:O-antigen/teichoic acid export membrane protein